MYKIWFSSDLHLGHARLLEFCNNTRQGKDIDEHDELFIEIWNSVVHPGDVCYRDWETDRKSTRLNSSHSAKSRMPSSA